MPFKFNAITGRLDLVNTAAAGTVIGPGSSTDNAVARWDGTTGALLQNSVVIIGDTGATTGITTLNISGIFTASSGQVVKVTLPAGDYTILTSDYFVGVSTAAARAITLPATPTTGQSYRIKDITGTAAAFNITVSGNGSNIDGAATRVISVNYGSIDVVYTGTIWAIV